MNNCSNSPGQTNMSDNFELKIKNTEHKNEKIDIQPKISGVWNFYRNNKGKGKEICNGKPCGFDAGIITLENDDKKLVGKILLSTNSIRKPVEANYATINSKAEGGYLILYYRDEMDCLIEYRILEVSDEKLFGEFSAKDCKRNLLPFYEGDFIAIRYIESNKS